MRNAAQRAFARLYSERSGGGVGRAYFPKGKMAFAKERRRGKALSGPEGTPFLQSAIHPLFNRKALRRIKRRRAVLHIAAKIWHSLVGRRRQHAYGREQPRNTPRIPQRTQTPPHGGRDAAAHGFPPAAVYAVHNKRSASPAVLPAANGTRQLSGCFRPPMRRLRAVMDAIAHTRDNSRPSDGCRAYRHSGRLAHCGRCQIHASSTDRSLSGIFQHCGKSRCPPLFYAQ